MKTTLIPKSLTEVKNYDVSEKFNTLTKDFKDGSIRDLLDSILEVRISPTGIHVKLNKNLIIETDNIITISKGENIQIANTIHLNPTIKK